MSRSWVLLVVMGILSCSVYSEDLIRTRNGSTALRGKVVDITPDEVVIELHHGLTIGLARHDIVSITRDGIPLSLETGQLIYPTVPSVSESPREVSQPEPVPTQTPPPAPSQPPPELPDLPEIPLPTPNADEPQVGGERFYRIEGQRVRLREGPSTDFPVVVHLNEGDLVREATEVEHWKQVQVTPLLKGWVHGSLVRPVSSAVYVVTGEGVRVRTRPDLQSDILTRVADGDVVYLLAVRGDWSRIWVPGGTFGWVASRYLELAEAMREKWEQEE